MATITDPDNLSQGTANTIGVCTFSGTSNANTVIEEANIGSIVSAGDYFEVRFADLGVNNGLYYCVSANTTQAQVIKVAGDGGASPADDSNTNATTQILGEGSDKSVYFDWYNREIWLLKNSGTTLTDDGVTLQTLYSFAKEEWKNDEELIKHPFPFVAITPEQFELDDSWTFHTGTLASGQVETVQDQESRKLVRTGGWREIGSNGVLDREYVGIITLGTFEDDTNDFAYYEVGNDPTSNTTTTDFTFAGPVNEAILSYNYITTVDWGANELAITNTDTITRSDVGGSWIDDGYKVGAQITIVTSDTAGDIGTYEILTLTATVMTISGSLTNDSDNQTFSSAVNYRNKLNIYLRSDYLFQGGDVNGKTYAKQTLDDIGAGTTGVDNKVFRFPISSVLDLNIDDTDATIAGGAPWDKILIRYFDNTFTQEVVANQENEYGIVIDVGTHSGVDGSVSSGGTDLTTADANANLTIYDSGVLTIHSASGNTTASVVGNYTIGDITVPGTIPISSGTFPATESNISFTLQRATPIVATTEEIYEAVQYQLRQPVDINAMTATGDVIGRTADELLRFVGTDLEAGQSTSAASNPAGGGQGVNIQGFDSNDTNSIKLFDNSGVSRSFPFVAAGTITFNDNLQDDSNAKYWMFYEYTSRTFATGAVTATVAGNGRDVDFSCPEGATEFPVLNQYDYINISGWTGDNVTLNGIYRVTAVANTNNFDAYKLSVADGVPSTATASGGEIGAIGVDENPIDSPDAIIVDDNNDSPITGLVSAQSSVTFDFDYDNNTQGGRTAATNAAVIIRAIGFDTAQFVEQTGTIERATGLSFSLVSALERNYQNT